MLNIRNVSSVSITKTSYYINFILHSAVFNFLETLQKKIMQFLLFSEAYCRSKSFQHLPTVN
jgi:hypothetical protein